MEVKPGYKQTEVGVIPEEWDVKPLGEIVELATSGSRRWQASLELRNGPHSVSESEYSRWSHRLHRLQINRSRRDSAGREHGSVRNDIC